MSFERLYCLLLRYAELDSGNCRFIDNIVQQPVLYLILLPLFNFRYKKTDASLPFNKILGFQK